MIKLLTGVLALVLAATGAMAAPASPADRATIDRLAVELDKAWDAKNWQAIVDQYSANATLRLGPSSQIVMGHDDLARYYQAMFERRADGLRHITIVDRVEMVAPDMVFADIRAAVQRKNGAEWVTVGEFSVGSLLVREASGWKNLVVRSHPLNSPTNPATPVAPR